MPRAYALAALARREAQIAGSYRLSYGLGFVIGMLNLIVYFLISRTIDSARVAELGAAPSFFAFAAVGVVLSSVLQVSSMAVAQRMREEQLTGSLEALLGQPLKTTELALGLAGFPLAFALGRAVIYLAAAALLLGLPLDNLDLVGIIAVLAAAVPSFVAIGATLAAAVLVMPRSDSLAGVITSALGIAGGAFFPIAVLPSAVETAAPLLPTYHAFEGARAALFEGAGWGTHCLFLAGIGIATLPLALVLFGLGIRRLRRLGAGQEL